MQNQQESKKMIIPCFQVMEAIYFGVPMVGMPVFNDQVIIASIYDYTTCMHSLFLGFKIMVSSSKNSSTFSENQT